MEKYFNVLYEDAIKFLQNLPEEKLEDMYNKYSIFDDYNKAPDSEYGIIVSKVEQLADTISDEDLFSLGFTTDDMTGSIYGNFENNNNNTEENIEENISNFLNSLDDNIKNDLFNHYDTHNLAEIAEAITDIELEKLGYAPMSTTENFDDSFSYDMDLLFEDDPCEEYDEELDFLEDIPCTVNYTVIDKPKLIFCAKSPYDFEEFKNHCDPNLVKYCESLDTIDDGTINDNYVFFQVEPISYDQPVQEEVIINSELNPNLFDENHHLKDEVQQQILEYIGKLVEYLKNKDIDVDYTDIHLIGSNAGYLYTPESDIDIHFIWSYPMFKDNFDQLRDEIKLFVSENPFAIGNNDIEINVEDGDNMQASSKRRYSLISSDWVDDSDKEEIYTDADMSKVEGYEDIVKNCTERINYVVDYDKYSEALALKAEIRKNRSDDLANFGSLSMGNVVFKELRNNGAFGKLRNYIKEKEMEIEKENIDE